MATPAAGLPADAPESRFTLAELRAQHQAIIKARQILAARQAQLDRARQLGAQLAASINECQALQNKLDDLTAGKVALQALQAIIQAEGGAATSDATAFKARADALVQLRARRDLALAAYQREQAAPGGLGQDYAAGFRQQIKDGKLLPVRRGFLPLFCDPQPGDPPGSNCGFDPREPSEIYIAAPMGPDWEGRLQPYQQDPSGLFISMLQWRAAEDQSTRNLDAPWPGEGPDAVPEPTDPRIKFARATDNYGMFSSSQNYDPAQLTQHENIFLQAARGAYLRRQSAKERAADVQIGLYAAAALTGGVAGFAAIGVTAAVIAAASAAALAAAVASSSGLPPEKLTDPLAVLAALDRIAFRAVYQTAAAGVKATMDAMAVLDKYVPGWAVVVDVLLPMGPLLPTLMNAIGNAAGVGFDQMNGVLQAGGKVAEAAKLGPIYDPAASVVSDALRAGISSTVTTAARATGVLPEHLLAYNATISKAILTMETTKGDLLQKIEAASIEVAQGISAVVALATAVISGGATLVLYAAAQSLLIAAKATAETGVDPVISKALELTGEAVSALSGAMADPVGGPALSLLKKAADAGVIVGQADMSARVIRTAARVARNATLAAAGQLDQATAKLKAEIAQIQAARAALRAREGPLVQAAFPIADALGVSEGTVLWGGGFLIVGLALAWAAWD